MVTRVVYDGHDFVEPESTPTNPSSEPVAHPVSVKPDAGRTVSINADGETAERAGALRMNSNELFNTDGQGILSTARNDFGRPVSGAELGPKTIVSVTKENGETMTMTLAGAEHAGLVKRGPDGSYTETSAEERQDGAQTEETNEAEAFSRPEAEAELVSLANALPAEIHHEVIAAYVGGRDLDVARIHDIGASVGQTPEEFQQRLNSVVASFQGQADAAVKALGIEDGADLQDFYEWARTNQKGALADAMRQHCYARSTRGYVELANKWLNSTPPSEEALKKAGYKLGKTGDGKTTTIVINGREMSLEVAARRGLI